MKKTATLLFLLFVFKISFGADYECSDAYAGNCYDCLYNDEAVCHRALPQTIYKNGVIYTVDDSNSFGDWLENPAEAMVVENGKITFVGTNEEAQSLTKPRSRTVDLKWKTVLPGIHDNHMHPLEAGSTVGGTCDLPSDTPPDSTEMLKLFRERCFDAQTGTSWALGHGHSVWTMLDYVDRTGKDPKKLLDDLIVDQNGKPIPALMMEETSHSFWVNSEALRQAGIDNSVKDRDGMVYMRNPTTNEVNGVLLENAGISIMEFAMDPVKYPALRDLAYEGLKNGLYELARNGITSAVDARSYWTREHHKAWERARDEKTLTVKAILSMWAYPEKDDKEQIPKLRTFFDNNRNTRLRKSQIKVYMDGLLNTRTATVIGGYLSDYPDLGIGNNGINYFNSTRLETYMRELQDIGDDGAGFDFIVHTVGDKGVRDMLDAVEGSKGDDQGVPARHKATHIELVHRDDRARFKKLGVIADGQVAGAFTMPDNAAHKDLERLVGKARASESVPINSLLQAGAKVTLSSDWDVSNLNPFLGMANSLGRAGESITLKEAVELYTINGAYSMRQDDRTGTLSVGKDADFIVIDQDIFLLEANSQGKKIAQTKVLTTVLEGEEIYKVRF